MALLHRPLALRAERAGGGRHVDVVLARILRERGQHPDDRVHVVVHLDDFPDHILVAAELALPVGVAEHHDRFHSEVIVCVNERAAEGGRDAQHLEEIGGDDAGVDAVGIALVEHHERHRVVLDEIADGRQALAVGDQLRDRHAGVRHVRPRGGLLDQDQLIASSERQRLQQDAVDDREHRRVGADAKRQNQHRGDGVARRAPQRPPPERDVLSDRFEKPAHDLASDATVGLAAAYCRRSTRLIGSTVVCLQQWPTSRVSTAALAVDSRLWKAGTEARFPRPLRRRREVGNGRDDSGAGREAALHQPIAARS